MERLQLASSLDSSEQIFNISGNGFQELQKAGLTLDQLFFLECCKHQLDLKDIVSRDKVLTWRQSLIRKGFLSEANIPTVDGLTILTSVGSGKPFKGSIDERKQQTEDDFETWWKEFPSNDTFEYKGKKFSGSRSLKRNKTDCKKLFEKIINEGEFTAQDLISSIKKELLQKKDLSFKTKENRMQYMPNSLSYLNQRQFEGFVGDTEEEPIINQSNEDI